MNRGGRAGARFFPIGAGGGRVQPVWVPAPLPIILKTLLPGLLLAGGLLLQSGCATPATRIRHQPEVFARLTPEQQQLVQAGQIGLGFAPAPVRLALGEPDRVWTRTEARGVSEIWSYVTAEEDDGRFLPRGRRSLFGAPFHPWYAGDPEPREHEYLRVVFTGGQVSAIERATR